MHLILSNLIFVDQFGKTLNAKQRSNMVRTWLDWIFDQNPLQIFFLVERGLLLNGCLNLKLAMSSEKKALVFLGEMASISKFISV